MSQDDVFSADNVKQLLDRWTESLAQVIESMTDQRPEVKWQAARGTASELGRDQEYLWWEQPFQAAPHVTAWVAAPRATWEQAGALTLKAAGLETVETSEAKNAWVEILGQALAVMARSIGSLLGREVTTEAGTERSPDSPPGEWAAVTITFAGTPEGAAPNEPPLLMGLSPELVALVTAPPPNDGNDAEASGQVALAQEAGAGSDSRSAPVSRTMELLLDVDLPVSISFGKAKVPMKDVLKLTTGSIVELDRSINEMVEVLVNHCLIARGEVVVVEGNYGVRIQEIASRQDRLRSLR
ncbi:MAG: flagellar motor switch protein FliN [Bryobacteraceae bacterium]